MKNQLKFTYHFNLLFLWIVILFGNIYSSFAQNQPKIQITGSNLICVDDALIIRLNHTYARYNWSVTNATTPVTEFKARFAGVFKIWCNVVDFQGKQLTSDSLTITVSSRPSPAIVQYDPNAKVLNAFQVTGKLQWFYRFQSGGDSLISGATSSTFRPLGTGLYYLQNTNENGCSSRSNVVGVCFPAKINVLGNTNFCIGNSVVLDAGPGFQTYEWSNGSKGQMAVITPKGEGTFHIYCTLKTPDCISYSDTITLIARPLPAEPTLYYDKTKNELKCYQNQRMTRNPSWYLGDGINPDTALTYNNGTEARRDSILKPEKSGLYYAVVSNENGCGRKTKPIKINLSTNRPDEDALGKWSVSPNPTDSPFLLTHYLPDGELYTIEIFNFLGNKVIDAVFESNLESKLINIDELVSGVYITVIKNQSNTKKATIKLVKQ